jgi:hypothetical protein
MSGIQLVVAYCIFGMVIGGAASTHISAALLVSESLDSPNPLVRWWYRHCMFAKWHALGALVTPIILYPIANTGPEGWLKTHVWLLALVPVFVSLPLCWAERRFRLRYDWRKEAAREELRARHGGLAGR